MPKHLVRLDPLPADGYIRRYLMRFRLFLFFTLVPVVELSLLVQVGSRIGVGPTVALVILTGVAGAWLARAQGLRALIRLQDGLRAGRFPGDEIFDGVLILVGGLLLLTPGFLTDLVGLAALVPGTRHLLKAILKRQVGSRLRFSGPGPAATTDPGPADPGDGQAGAVHGVPYTVE